MNLGTVIGIVWSTKKVKEMKACRLLVVQPMLSDGSKTSLPLVVADPQNIASVGDRVVFVTSTDAAQAFDSGFAPVNASIVALVDEVS